MASKFEYDDVVYTKLDQALNFLEGGHANPIMTKTAVHSIFTEWEKDTTKDKCFKRFAKYVLKTANFGGGKTKESNAVKNLKRRIERAEHRNEFLVRVNKSLQQKNDDLNIRLDIAMNMLTKEIPSEEKKE